MQNINAKNFNFLSLNNERKKINLDLTRMRQALLKLDNPCLNTPAVQIVGTNVVRIVPPLIISKNEMNIILKKLSIIFKGL